ncbi:hypothetical protein VKT23_020250 [Stygiomarasmius scandens]
MSAEQTHTFDDPGIIQARQFASRGAHNAGVTIHSHRPTATKGRKKTDTEREVEGVSNHDYEMDAATTGTADMEIVTQHGWESDEEGPRARPEDTELAVSMSAMKMKDRRRRLSSPVADSPSSDEERGSSQGEIAHGQRRAALEGIRMAVRPGTPPKSSGPSSFAQPQSTQSLASSGLVHRSSPIVIPPQARTLGNLPNHRQPTSIGLATQSSAPSGLVRGFSSPVIAPKPTTSTNIPSQQPASIGPTATRTYRTRSRPVYIASPSLSSSNLPSSYPTYYNGQEIPGRTDLLAPPSSSPSSGIRSSYPMYYNGQERPGSTGSLAPPSSSPSSGIRSSYPTYYDGQERPGSDPRYYPRHSEYIHGGLQLPSGELYIPNDNPYWDHPMERAPRLPNPGHSISSQPGPYSRTTTHRSRPVAFASMEGGGSAHRRAIQAISPPKDSSQGKRNWTKRGQSPAQ